MLYADIGALGKKALIYEVLTGPKPGLVDRFNPGAHRDMDALTFILSAQSLENYFAQCAAEGGRAAGTSGLLSRLRPLGIEAEKTMYAATGGVNTHKGAVFSMGLLCAAAGFLPEGAGASEICRTAGEIAAPVKNDFLRAAGSTFGERLYQKTGDTGIRGEAAAGFPSVIETGLPALNAALDSGLTLNESGISALMKLITCVRDTALIKRCGTEERFLRAQREAEAVLKAPDILSASSLLDMKWSEEGLSAGGCADLLSLVYFLYFMENAEAC